MKFVLPEAELLRQGDDYVAHVAKCARVCYDSKSKGADNDLKLYNGLIKSNHRSMLRHDTYYAHLTGYNANKFIIDKSAWDACPYVDYAIIDSDNIYVVTNGQFIKDAICYYNVFGTLFGNRISYEELKKVPIAFNNIARHTIRVVTQISTSRELNRMSPNNIAERSTRYVMDSGTICLPHWISLADAKAYLDDGHKGQGSAGLHNYMETVRAAFDCYNTMVNCNGVRKQDARGILPLDTATEVVYTYTIKEWRHLLDLRLYNTTGGAHPNAHAVCKLIRNILVDEGHAFLEPKDD